MSDNPEKTNTVKKYISYINTACLVVLILGVLPLLFGLWAVPRLQGPWGDRPHDFLLNNYVYSGFLILTGSVVWLYKKKSVTPAVIIFSYYMYNIIQKMILSNDVSEGLFDFIMYGLILGACVWSAICLKKNKINAEAKV